MTGYVSNRYVFLCALLGLLVCAGCQHYEVDVVLEPDGSGKRSVALIVDSKWKEGDNPSPAELKTIFSVGEKFGWRPLSERPLGPGGRGEEEEQQEARGFWRETTVPDLDGWRDLSGDIHILGALPGGEFTNANLHNIVAVEIGEGPRGRIFTYRETCMWDGVKQILIDFQANSYRDAMAAAYPFLGAAELAELKGLMAGHLSLGWMALAVDDELDNQTQPIVSSVAWQSEAIVRRARPGADTGAVLLLVEEVVTTEGDAADEFFEEQLPGFNVAIWTELQLIVHMPGLVTETNGEVEDGHTVSWSVDLTEAVVRPVEMYARSELME